MLSVDNSVDGGPASERDRGVPLGNKATDKAGEFSLHSKGFRTRRRKKEVLNAEFIG